MLILEAPENIKAFDYIFDCNYYFRYSKIAAHSEEDRLKKLAYIIQNEFFFIDFNQENLSRKGIRYTEGLGELTVEEAVEIIAEFTKALSTRKSQLDIIYAGHARRTGQHQSNRYERWRASIFEMFQDHKYCFQCGATENLEPDHCLHHDSFKSPKKAWSLKNGQLLCSAHNQLKGNRSGREWDFRKPEHIRAIFSYREKTGTDFIE